MEEFKKAIEAETWLKGKPIYYSEEGRIIEEWSDGRKIIIYSLEKAWAFQNTERVIDGDNILGELRKLNQEIPYGEI